MSNSSEPSEKQDELGLSTGNPINVHKQSIEHDEPSCDSTNVTHLNAVVSGQVEAALNGDNGNDEDNDVNLRGDRPSEGLVAEADRQRTAEKAGSDPKSSPDATGEDSYEVASPEPKSSPEAAEDAAPPSSRRGSSRARKRSTSRPPDAKRETEDEKEKEKEKDHKKPWWDEVASNIEASIKEQQTDFTRDSLRPCKISDDINQVRKLAKLRKIETVELVDPVPDQRKIRRWLLKKKTKPAIMYRLNSGDLYEGMDPREFYTAEAEIYKGYNISWENMARLFGCEEDDYSFLYSPDGVNPIKMVELAAGNADIAMKFADALPLEPFRALARKLRPDMRGKTIPLTVYDRLVDLLELVLGKRASRPGGLNSLVKSVWAVDYVDAHAVYAEQKGIIGVTSDICTSPQDFFRQSWASQQKLHEDNRRSNQHHREFDESTYLMPNSADIVAMNMALDRIQDFNAAIEIMKSLAKGRELTANGETTFVAPEDPKHATKFLIGSIFPLSTNSDSDMDEVPDIEFWKAVGSDPRVRMRQEFCENDPDRKNSGASPRAWAIYRFISELADKGLVVERIAEQSSYEVISLHSITGTVKQVREKYGDRLRAKRFIDPELAKLRDDVLAGRYPENYIVTFPQEYEGLVLVSGYIDRPIKVDP